MIYNVRILANKDNSSLSGYNQIAIIYNEDTFQEQFYDFNLCNNSKINYNEYDFDVQELKIMANSPEEALFKYRKWQNEGLSREYLLNEGC